MKFRIDNSYEGVKRTKREEVKTKVNTERFIWLFISIVILKKIFELPNVDDTVSEYCKKLERETNVISILYKANHAKIRFRILSQKKCFLYYYFLMIIQPEILWSAIHLTTN